MSLNNVLNRCLQIKLNKYPYNNMCFRNCKILLCPSTHHLYMKAKEYCQQINDTKHLNATNYSINTSNNKAFNGMASDDIASVDGMASVDDMASDDDMASVDDMVSDDEPCIYCYCCCCFAPFTMIYDCMCIPYTIYQEVVIREQIVDASLEEKLNSF